MSILVMGKRLYMFFADLDMVFDKVVEKFWNEQ